MAIEKTKISDETLSLYFSTVDVNNVIRFGKMIIVEFRALISTNIPDDTSLEIASRVSSYPAYSVIESYIGDRWFDPLVTKRVFSYFKSTNAIGIGDCSAGNWLHINGIGFVL